MSNPKKKKKPEAHKELKGFDIQIDEFGQVISSINHDKLNQFLDKNVVDKKMDASVLKQKYSLEEE